MSEFKVGDRIALYHWSKRYICIVTEIDGCTLMAKCVDSAASFLANPKQCRKLVKKERRRLWIDSRLIELRLNFMRTSEDGADLTDQVRPGMVEFVEVRRKK